MTDTMVTLTDATGMAFLLVIVCFAVFFIGYALGKES